MLFSRQRPHITTAAKDRAAAVESAHMQCIKLQRLLCQARSYSPDMSEKVCAAWPDLYLAMPGTRDPLLDTSRGPECSGAFVVLASEFRYPKCLRRNLGVSSGRWAANTVSCHNDRDPHQLIDECTAPGSIYYRQQFCTVEKLC